ncbi:TlpA family protein disulfide reductase [Corynebacterium sp. L4756]|uniref:TlpA family protein disulfide reductase n=1 Tax=Corynebacterium TaxID=1716 RepID=UPI0014595892|nr:TlpA family protein disulfide reductase [Corynebacterium ammoniagenes]NMF33118.1 TlpA family protein disulfide reductase [Corynebacterium ammoniagenes]
MNNSIKGYLIGGVLLTILVVLAVPIMLSGPEGQGSGVVLRSEEPEPDPVDGIAPNPAEVPQGVRPSCAGQGAAGVVLPCLGAENGDTPADGQPEGTEASVINVWAWWCEPCREELPIFDEFADAHPEYDVVGVHADAYPANGVEMLDSLEVDLPSYQDSDNTFAGTLGLPGVVPITVLAVDGEQVAVFAQTFQSVEELEQKVAEGLLGRGA